jgi:osmotically-inducible protein OsmY
MTTASLTAHDVRVTDAVTRALDWDPEVDASALGVSAHEGVVTLTGFIDSYASKLSAERIAKRVRGVRAVANDIEVRLKLDRTDPDIAADVVRALELRNVPTTVQAAVHAGHVTLTGRAAWLYQKMDAEKVARRVRGVRGVANYIDVAPQPVVRDVRRRITEALHRHAGIDARHIVTTIDGTTAILTGRVGSWPQRDAAERAAASAPGITQITNELVVEPPSIDTGMDEMC